MNEEAMRKAFEYLAPTWGITYLAKSDSPSQVGRTYWDSAAEVAWLAWQAATRAAVPAWQKIETAPRNGCLCLLCTDGGIVFVGKFNKHLQLWVDDEGRERFRTVKYWMPLPVPKEPT